MPTQGEKVVSPTNALYPQHFCPDMRQCSFDVTHRSFVLFARIGLRIGRGQCLAVYFAVGRERQCLQCHERRRHHVLGQLGSELLSQGLAAGNSPRLPLRRFARSPTLDGVVRHQPLLARGVFARQHNRLAHAFTFPKPCFYLT